MSFSSCYAIIHIQFCERNVDFCELYSADDLSARERTAAMRRKNAGLRSGRQDLRDKEK